MLGCALAGQIGHMPAQPYSALVSALFPSHTYQSFQSYQALSDCLNVNCDYGLVPETALTFFNGQISQAVLTDRLVTITKDERADNFSTLLWQFLVLLATLWLPGLLLASQVVYFLEIRKQSRHSYVYGSLLACWATVNLSQAKKDSMKVCLSLSWLFLGFLLLLIFLDLSSAHSALNSDSLVNSLRLYEQTVCTTPVIPNQIWANYVPAQMLLVKEAGACLRAVQDEECAAAVLGRLELAYTDREESGWNEDNDLILQELLTREITFRLITTSGQSLSSLNSDISALWLSGAIPTAIQSVSNSLNSHTRLRSPILLTSPGAVFTGLTILLVFVLLLLALAIRDLATRKERAVQTKLPEAQPLRQEMPSPTQRGNTLSLGSFSPKEGGGRPGEDWMQAVPVDDVHAQGVQNIQEYENELSAVPQANPSLGVSDSVFSLFKLEKRKS